MSTEKFFRYSFHRNTRKEQFRILAALIMRDNILLLLYIGEAVYCFSPVRVSLVLCVC